ncbi:Peptide alpha-n-acetyltransferase [Fasciola hepatica]|uniref:Peptide alpha-n-acetyltransferase n=1 Tax=Fasciola hepatica TaxID=6192 RepID=A0A4E0R623_FASHE|nr:Peptide alpha-n-acetyltransferase [Fasciola hepatica]
MSELDIQDVWLKAIVDPFENGNYKKALQELNKLLKKMPKLMSAKALKALTLVKMDKICEAVSLAEEVIAACPTDESTVSVMMCYFRETGQPGRVSQYLKNALEKCSNREDLLVRLFLSQVQEANFSAQQQTARQLSQMYSSRLYTYWVIVSTLMQAESDPILGRRMFLPLAEKMLSRDAEECRMETHIELQLLVGLLERLNKPSQALELLRRTDLLDRLDKLDYQVDYTLDRLRLVACLDDWNQVVELSSARLKDHPNEWNCWRCLIDTAVKNGQWEVCEPRQVQFIHIHT